MQTNILRTSVFTLLAALMLLIIPAAFAQSTTITLNAEAVNVRSGPGLEYTIRATFKGGELTATARNNFATGRVCLGENSDLDMWLRVDYRGVEGWVSRCAISTEGDVDTLAVAQASAPGLVEDLNTDTIEVEEDLGTEPKEAFVTAYTLGRVNFREAASVNATVKQILAAEQGIYVIGRNSSDTWVQVSFMGKTGWVARYLVLLPYDWQKTVPVK